MQVFCTFVWPGSTQNGCVVGILPFLSTSRATFVLKFGALTQTSTRLPRPELAAASCSAT